MTSSFGIKVSRPGFDVKTAAPNELAFSSAYKTLKVSSSGSGTLTQASRTATIPHNLGYIPIFMAHANLLDQFSSGEYFLLPAGSGSGAINNNDILAYADTTNLYIRAEANAGTHLSYPASGNDMGTKATFPWATGFTAIGRTVTTDNDTALRVTGVDIAQGTTITSANLFIYADFVSPSTNQTIKTTIHGFNEDNTSDFSSDPTGRALTTAVYSYTNTAFIGQYMGFDLTNIVQEIINRSAWTSGNAMGFRFQNNGTANNTYIEDNFDNVHTTDSYLSIIISNTVADYKYTIFLNQLE